MMSTDSEVVNFIWKSTTLIIYLVKQLYTLTLFIKIVHLKYTFWFFCHLTKCTSLHIRGLFRRRRWSLWNFFIQKAQAWYFIKKETLTQVFSCNFCGIFKNTFFWRTPLGDCFSYLSNSRASDICLRLLKCCLFFRLFRLCILGFLLSIY